MTPFHPLEGDLSHLKDAEVEAKLQELTKKYFQAQRLGNYQLLTQLSTFVTIYRDEMTMRYHRATKAASGQLDGDLDQLINVD
jgi:hypothetical protein